MTTQWTVVSELSWPSGQLSPERAQMALAQLCQDYWPPLYRFVCQRGYSEHDAQDLTQGFFAYLLEKKAYSKSDREKGRFRTFLLALLKRYLNAAHAHQHRKKRGGDKTMVCLDGRTPAAEAVEEDALLIAAPLDEERAFEWNWATALVSKAMGILTTEYASGQKARLFRELRPFLTGGVGLPTHDEAAACLGVSLETLRSHLFRLRARYRELLRTEVLRTVPREKDIDEELRYLCRILLTGARR